MIFTSKAVATTADGHCAHGHSRAQQRRLQKPGRSPACSLRPRQSPRSRRQRRRPGRGAQSPLGHGRAPRRIAACWDLHLSRSYLNSTARRFSTSTLRQFLPFRHVLTCQGHRFSNTRKRQFRSYREDSTYPGVFCQQGRPTAKRTPLHSLSPESDSPLESSFPEIRQKNQRNSLRSGPPADSVIARLTANFPCPWLFPKACLILERSFSGATASEALPSSDTCSWAHDS